MQGERSGERVIAKFVSNVSAASNFTSNWMVKFDSISHMFSRVIQSFTGLH